MLAPGRYIYEIHRGNELLATEEDTVSGAELSGVRRPAAGSDLFEASAKLSEQGQVVSVAARYSRGPFSRSANYEAAEEFMRGSVTAMGGRTVETAKLGRFREVDAGLVLFRALIVAHLRGRGQARWTGRVVTIDPRTLVARSHKQTCRLKQAHDHVFIYEPRMGDSEEIEVDDAGRIVRIVDNAGQRITLKSHSAG
jgi:hypothetical protein